MAEQKTAQEKGNALEQAVHAIELSILRAEPKAEGKDFTIETKKLIKVNNVPHEMDLYVTVHFAAGYDSVFIFECKNWANPVDKNEIIIFSEKIQVTQAAHGYFVAKSFTAGAKAQAEQDKRITLLEVKEHDPLLLASETSLSGYTLSPVSIGFNALTSDGSRVLLPYPSTEVSYRGTRTSMGQLIKSWADEATNEQASRIIEGKEPGEHTIHYEFVRELAAGELQVQDKNIQTIQGSVEANVFVYQQVIDYSFKIESRGRVITFRAVELPGGETIKSRIVIR